MFDWPMQLARHAKKCTKSASETEKKKVYFEGWSMFAVFVTKVVFTNLI